MRSIVYYNLSHDASKVANIANGASLDVAELIAANLRVDSLSETVRQLMASVKFDGIDPLGVEKSGRWENLMSVIIYCLCGKLPLRQEVLRGRQIMMALPKHLRVKEEAEKIAFSLLPYILVGFKTHIEDQFQADSNIVADVALFIEHLYDDLDPVATSFLCAHRGKSATEKHILIDSVQIQKAQVALNMIKGVLANDPWAKTRSIRWYQQGPTEWASLNMFPEMFLKYLTSGRISHLLTLLGRHFSKLEDMMRMAEPNQIQTTLFELDPVTLEVLSFLAERYGASWRSTDFSSARVAKDELVSLALDVTLSEVVRQMPFYSSVHTGQEYVDKKASLIAKNIELSQDSSSEQADLVRRVVERFFQAQVMHPTAKAVYETAFYYLWGKRSVARKGELAMGIDRDHHNFQYTAWKQGYCDGREMDAPSIPLLYARRTAEDSEGPALKDYCIRQFWR